MPALSYRSPKTITGQDWRRPDLQVRYHGYFSWYLERRIDRQEGR